MVASRPQAPFFMSTIRELLAYHERAKLKPQGVMAEYAALLQGAS